MKSPVPSRIVPSIGKKTLYLLRLLLLWSLIFAASVVFPAQGLVTDKPGPAGDDALVRAIVTSEETYLVLTRKLDVLSRGLLDLRLPGPSAEAASLFAPEVAIVDLGPEPAMITTNATMAESQLWPVTTPAKQIAKVDLWRPLLDAVSFFDHARLHIVSGEHPDGDMWRYEAAATFEAVARMKSGEWRSLLATLKLSWARTQTKEGRAGEWQITDWKTEEMRWNASAKRLFVEALDAALRAPQDPRMLRRSGHYEATLKYYREGMKNAPHPYFAPISANMKEGIAVADVNGDGFDDIYITVRIGKNMLLINHGDGTFTEEAAKYHLDLPGHTTCAIFADFDNDGDLDVILGRSLLRTTYLENRGGVFYQPPIPKFMPMAVISMSAADYNGDGLLDVYLCTYRPAPPAGSGTGGGYAQSAKEGDFDWPDEFFPPEQAREFRRRLAEHRESRAITVLDQIGPPNVLLINRGGGRFEPAPENGIVGLWRNSLQATWGDFNQDGRPDLYIANDWGLNVLFRNNGPAGFTDVTSEMGLTCYGFSMGASFGDYDNDGRDDLYVSNMYSEAGRRISARIPGLNPVFAEGADGNFLYHRESNGKFKQLAGLKPPALTVKQAGWSWGGDFVDFDNDGFLDLYVLNGYYTAPKELSSGVDLESNLWRTMVRADEGLSSGFRFSPEWKRTPAPDNLGPEIDARLAGVERQGDKILVHSLHGNERNRYFANRGGHSFVDLSGLSGLDNPADGRGFAVLDYDRDGWQDVALVNANEPLFNLYHNEMAAAGLKGGMIALRFVGGNKTPAPSKEFACRDGYGARVTVDLGDVKIVREHRCGDGWSTQNSATMIVGIGTHANVASAQVRWPSGKTASTQNVPEGTLLRVYENPADSPTGEAFTREPYRVKQSAPPAEVRVRPVFPVRALDIFAKPARLRVYITFTTTCASCTSLWPVIRRLKEELSPEGVDFIAVPSDETDDNPKLIAYGKQWQPAARLGNILPANRAEVVAAFAKALGQAPPLPSTVVTDDSGHMLWAQPGVPSISAVRKALSLEAPSERIR